MGAGALATWMSGRVEEWKSGRVGELKSGRVEELKKECKFRVPSFNFQVKKEER